MSVTVMIPFVLYSQISHCVLRGVLLKKFCHPCLNFRCEFMEKLNLNQFLQDPAEHLGHYTLHAVLVHSGKCRASFIVGKKRPKKRKKKKKEISCCMSACYHIVFTAPIE